MVTQAPAPAGESVEPHVFDLVHLTEEDLEGLATFSKDARLKRLLADPPMLHRLKDLNPAAGGGLTTWAIQPSVLAFIVEAAGPTSLTLETGSGVSTICFALAGSEHTCISPAPGEHERIRGYCRRHGISTAQITFAAMRSQEYLPRLDFGGRELDVALIDGSHAFPDPLLDYCYVNEHLRTGGLLIIDDLPISGVGILHKFLATEPAYRLVALDEAKTGIYRKAAETRYPNDWLDQAFNRRYPDWSFPSPAARVGLRTHAAVRRVRQTVGRLRAARSAYRACRRVFAG